MKTRYQKSKSYLEPTQEIIHKSPHPRAQEVQRRQKTKATNIPPKQRNPLIKPCCCFVFLLIGALVAIAGLYFLFPFRTNILIIGIDYTDITNAIARSDTIIMTTFQPSEPYIGMLSVPRDLWVNIPGIGENRINTAHYFAEAQQTDSGPAALALTIQQNFGVAFPYYLRVRFEAFREIVNAMGGVDIELTEPMAGYPPGKYHLTGNKALAFVRYRQNSDDFFRMQNGQFMAKAIFKNMLNSKNWPRIPDVAKAFFNSTDTNIPNWLLPRLGLVLLRLGPDGIDNRIITREMVTPFVTSEGAYVLAPNWQLIHPLVREMFGE